MVYITRRKQFNAAHKLYVEEWSQEKNFKVFGKCANPNWHGHNFILYVTVKGKPDPTTGMVMDFTRLGNIMKERVVNKLDHKNLNEDVDFMQGIQPTVENLAVAIWKELAPAIQDPNLHAVKIYETENNFVEYFGD